MGGRRGERAGERREGVRRKRKRVEGEGIVRKEGEGREKGGKE